MVRDFAMRVTAALVLLTVACSAQRQTVESSHPPATKHVTPHADALRVALTFDDLGSTVESSEPALSAKILQALAAEHAPVAVFANCQHLRRDTLQLWQQAGATFGNHTTTHLSLDGAGPDDAWWKDVQGCDAQLKDALGGPVAFFRFPYLRYGKTAEFHAQAAQKLATLGYAIAHVTAATSEWLLANYYEQALKKQDAALVRDLAAAYIDHMLESLQAARELALEKTGKDVAQITLAHVNQLAADHLSDVLQRLSSHGWQFVTLREALADPVYALPDAYVGGCGCSWLARIAPALSRDDSYVFGDYEAQLRERFELRVKALADR